MNLVIIIILILSLLGMATIWYITYTKPATCTLASNTCDDKLPCCDKNYSCTGGTCKIKPEQPSGKSGNSGCVPDEYQYKSIVQCCTNTSSLATITASNSVCIPFGTTPNKSYPDLTKDMIQYPKYCSNLNEQCAPGSEYPCCSILTYCKTGDDGTSYCVDAVNSLSPS